MSDELVVKLSRALESTGFPLELRAAAVASRLGWAVFHSVQYYDPETRKLRELDLLLYKLIRGRRVEVRISCKSSKNKQFVFFTHDSTPYLYVGQLKITPVADFDLRRKLPEWLQSLPFFSHTREAVNYTVAMGDQVDRDSKVLLREALLSVVNSVHHRILPDALGIDPRGTIYFFVVLLRGRMFEAWHDNASNALALTETDYARWSGRIEIPERYNRIVVQMHDGTRVPFDDALYHFSDRIRVEFINESLLEKYLTELEEAFQHLPKEALAALGAEWTSENFPKHVRPARSLVSTTKSNKNESLD